MKKCNMNIQLPFFTKNAKWTYINGGRAAS